MLRSCTRQGQRLFRTLTAQQACPLGAAAFGNDTGDASAFRTVQVSLGSHGSHHRHSFSAVHRNRQSPTICRQAVCSTTPFQAAHFASSTSDSPGTDHPDQDAQQQQAALGQQREASAEQSLPAVLEEDLSDNELEPTEPSGQRGMSLGEYDQILDRWGELLKEGKLDEILDLMEYAYGGYEPLPPLEQMLASVSFCCSFLLLSAAAHHACIHMNDAGDGFSHAFYSVNSWVASQLLASTWPWSVPLPKHANPKHASTIGFSTHCKY